MIEEFKKYVDNYDLNNENIKLKYNHSLRVMALSRKYAVKLGFSKDEVELAALIGLLHDIGRFEQINIYNSFDDLKTIDHADFSVQQLFEMGLIRNFWKKEEDYELIKFAIQNHNKLKIPNISNEKFVKFAKLIRDVDKIDILYLLCYKEIITTDDPISDEIRNDIFKHKQASRKYAKNDNDKLAIHLSFAFDINYDICLKEFKQNFVAYCNLIKNKKVFQEVINEIENYIDERMVIC